MLKKNKKHILNNNCLQKKMKQIKTKNINWKIDFH